MIDTDAPVSTSIVALSPGLRGGGEGRPGTHCMRMRQLSREFSVKMSVKVGGNVHGKVLRNKYTESHALY